ncbi:AAEL005383-PA [Aedes aegypti]|uniref:Protein adenylyltransferase Fic n=1 Tax=Aedes aegypti TaxID=7159 RepID=FICD_AEDAE|nr:adenosine monophosphate-protein transferase FICD homolog [Aedes aegypti]Q17A75.1 RecName: Full=Protein adenylyltransferase Fic; AltName: Full=De-AMPylase Fic [Aedes aegypti]EAT43151.1 AAEL005383-PA [Aedes aegypti]
MCCVCGEQSPDLKNGLQKQSRSARRSASKKWRYQMNSFHYFVIFASGSLFSGLMFGLLNYAPKYVLLPTRSAPHHLPDGKFLQISDEARVMEPYFPAVRMAGRLGDGNNGSGKIRTEPHDTNEQEALSSLKVAIEMKTMGKDDKAARLFQHALALSPKHPEILTKYGEFLEHNQQDVVRADHYYYQALTVNPSHSEALANRQRTAQIVEHLDQKRFERLDQKRDALSSVSDTNMALKRAEKEAYIQHIYHSVGIEGNTMSLAQTRSILETRMAVDGKSIDEHNEILGLDAAMKYINATLVNKNDFITLKDILEIHRRVLGHVDPIEGGEFRRSQVYVGGHVPPGPGDLSILMNHFESWLNSKQAFLFHPVKYAAMAHYKLVHIHPFSDGNGRTSRLLMNTLLMRAGYPPVIIQKQHRHKYYDYLQVANEGDIRPFVRFIADCTERTLDLYLWATSELSHPVPLLAQETMPDGVPLINSFEKESTIEGSGAGEAIRIGTI